MDKFRQVPSAYHCTGKLCQWEMQFLTFLTRQIFFKLFLLEKKTNTFLEISLCTFNRKSLIILICYKPSKSLEISFYWTSNNSDYFTASAISVPHSLSFCGIYSCMQTFFSSQMLFCILCCLSNSYTISSRKCCLAYFVVSFHISCMHTSFNFHITFLHYFNTSLLQNIASSVISFSVMLCCGLFST